jgi:hypothetical protein
MAQRWGEVNQSRLAREAKISKSATDRLKKVQGEFRSETLVAIAKALKAPVWQLVYPELDPARPPQVLPYSEMAVEAAKALDGIADPADKAQVYAMILALTKLGGRRLAELTPRPESQPASAAKTRLSRPR